MRQRLGPNLFSDKLRLIYLQLPCFIKEADDCENDFERWIYVLKNMDTLNRMPWVAQNAVFQRLSEIAEVSAMTKEERIKYDHALKVYRDTLNAYNGAVQKGRAEGLAEGMEKGMEKGKSDVARKLKAKGFDIADIIDATGLTEEQINAL